MKILTIRSDNPEAEIGLFDGDKKLAYETWLAHRQLAETIFVKIDELLASCKLALADIEGIVGYEGPGSFTGLRIGLTVANTLAYSLEIPIVASGGEKWRASGIKKLQAGIDEKTALPKYGAPVHITAQKK